MTTTTRPATSTTYCPACARPLPVTQSGVLTTAELVGQCPNLNREPECHGRLLAKLRLNMHQTRTG
jgi:hypothetical protein